MTGKKIAVLGGGNGAHTMAAEFTLKGHTVNMYEMPQFKDGMKKVFETETIICDGVVKGTAKLNMVTDDIAKAVDGCRYICIVAPAFAHEGYAKLLKGHLHSDQVVVTFPGAFSALRLKKEFGNDPDCPVFADANNLPYDARLTAKGSDRVNSEEIRSILPSCRQKQALPLLMRCVKTCSRLRRSIRMSWSADLRS